MSTITQLAHTQYQNILPGRSQLTEKPGGHGYAQDVSMLRREVEGRLCRYTICV